MKSLSGNGNGNENPTQLACSESYPVLNIYTLPMFGDELGECTTTLRHAQYKAWMAILCLPLLYFTLLCSAWYSVAYVGKGANYK